MKPPPEDLAPLAKVIIHQSTRRPWGTLMTGSSPDPDRVYVGSKEWQAAHPQEWADIKARMRRAGYRVPRD